MSIKGHRDQIERDFWRETFGERPLERDLWRETFGEKNEEALIAVGGNEHKRT